MSDVSHWDVGGVRVLTISRPSRVNALRRDTIDQLSNALALAETQSAEAVVLTGDGGRFSAGADVSELSGTIDDLDFDDQLEALTLQIQGSPIPVVAAVESICFGAAIDLAWSCDLVAISRDARVALPATRLGILYNPTSLARLHARLGSAVLRRLVVVAEELTGEVVGAGGAAMVVEPGTATDAAIKRLNGREVPAATAAAKGVIAALDRQDFDPSDWQEIRQTLLSAPERSDALRLLKEKMRDDEQ